MSKETMKEKFQKAKTKVTEGANKVLTITTKFIGDHPYLMMFAVAIGAGSIAAVSDYKSKKADDSLLDSADRVYTKIEEKDTLWREEYRDTYDKVIAFAETLNLAEGEAYVIEDQKQYFDCYTDLDRSRPIVSHLIFNEGVYPNE